VQLDRIPFGEAVLCTIVQLRREAEAFVTGKSSIEVTHGDDGRDPLEHHFRHSLNRRRRVTRCLADIGTFSAC
jgi:hypothetical protein